MQLLLPGLEVFQESLVKKHQKMRFKGNSPQLVLLSHLNGLETTSLDLQMQKPLLLR